MQERRGHIVLSGGRGLVGGHLRVVFRKERCYCYHERLFRMRRRR